MPVDRTVTVAAVQVRGGRCTAVAVAARRPVASMHSRPAVVGVMRAVTATWGSSSARFQSAACSAARSRWAQPGPRCRAGSALSQATIRSRVDRCTPSSTGVMPSSEQQRHGLAAGTLSTDRAGCARRAHSRTGPCRAANRAHATPVTPPPSTVVTRVTAERPA